MQRCEVHRQSEFYSLQEGAYINVLDGEMRTLAPRDQCICLCEGTCVESTECYQ